MEHIFVIFIFNIFEEYVSCFGYAAAYNEDLGIDYAGYGCKAFTKVMAKLRRYLLCNFVPGLYRIKYGLGS